MKKVMFVCTGNICRSPMAHGYMQKRIFDLKKEKECIISSCGISAVTGENATLNAIEAIKEYDVDISSHIATNILDSNILEYDIIFALTKSHKDAILLMYPVLKNKTYILKGYAINDVKYEDIDDPFGLSKEVYKGVVAEIVNSIDLILEKI